MKYTARRMASRLASSPKWQAVPGGLLALRALRDAGGAAFPLRKPDKVYGKIGSLEVRLTRRRRDIKLAQRLRYKVFYEEMSAIPTLRAELRRRDEDPYDAVCDHLIVEHLPSANVVGTYRLQTGPNAAAHLGYPKITLARRQLRSAPAFRPTR